MIKDEMFSFRLTPDFVEGYKSVEPDWGWRDEAGNSIGELTFVRTYSRLKGDGTKERWYETCERVINGMYSLQKDHALANRLEWDGHKAQRSAREAYDRMFNFKWTPPGRGIAQMGTPLVNLHKNGASLQNCAVTGFPDDNRHDPGFPFAWVTEAMMLGVGIGANVAEKSKLMVNKPLEDVDTYAIPDTREGWAVSIGKLVNSYLKPNKPRQEFDYSEIRPYGSVIATFGGTASGPEPLADGHEKIRAVLDKNVGETLTTRTIVDIYNLIGCFVVAGNARRSAELMMGNYNDDDFASLKDPDGFADRPWGYMSNNSIDVKVGDDYSKFMPRTVQNGEPGFIWMDTTRAYGRLIDPPNNKDHRAAAYNPCQPAWAPVLTPGGISTIGEIGIGDAIWSEDGWVTVENKWSTGVKNVNRYRTTGGYVDVTDTHRVVSGGVKIQARHASSLDRISGPAPVVPKIHMQDVVDGLVVGDGFKHRASNDAFMLCIGADDQDYFEYIDDFINHSSDKTYYVASSLNKSELSRRVFDRTIPDAVFYGDDDKRAGFLKGLYSANGSVCGSRVTLKATSRALIDQVQVMLSAFGISSYVTTNKANVIEWDNGSYESRESYDLNIGTQVGREIFSESIGFLQHYKMDKLRDIIDSHRGGTKSKVTFDIASVESLGDHEVFDITVSGANHTYWSNGINVSNCAEQSLEKYECCTLVEVHLNRAESIEDFIRTLKFAYLYAKTVTLLTTPWPKTNAVMQRNRRIGLSATGIAGFVDEHNLYEFRKWADAGYNEVQRLDDTYSEWLGIRNSIKTTTVKPSGTVSLLSGATPGVHWAPGGKRFLRAIRFGGHDDTWKLLRDSGYEVEDDVYSPNTKVVYFPLQSPGARSESEVSIYEKIHLASEAQKYWSDNSVSVTVSFDSKREAEDVPKVLRMYEASLKTVSFLPMSGEVVYEQMPYQKLSESQYLNKILDIRRIDTDALYGYGAEAESEEFCTTDVCELPKR